MIGVSSLIKTSFFGFIKFFEVFEALFLKMIKSLSLLVLKVLTLEDLISENCSPPPSLILEDLLATTSLTLVLARYIASFTTRAAIIIIKALRLRNITTRKKATNIIIIIERFKRKKVKVI